MAEHPPALFWRAAVEVLKVPTEALLDWRRQVPEEWVVLQRLLLFSRRQRSHSQEERLPGSPGARPALPALEHPLASPRRERIELLQPLLEPLANGWR